MGGAICALIQILIDKTALTPARILVGLVVLGVFLYAIGVYDVLFSLFGSGVSVPLLGFGATIAKGTKEAITEKGIIGIISGGLSATSAGISTALILGLFASLISKTRARRMGGKKF